MLFDLCKSTHQVPRTSQAAIFQAGKHAGAPHSGSLSIVASHALIASHVRSLPPTQTPETLKGRQATTVDFNIKAKKNDKRRLGSTKSIIDQTGPMSINNAHEEWMMQHNTLASPLLSSAYFVEQNGNPTTTRTFRNELAVVNSVIHGLPKGILPHSFRKGAASTLDAHGFSDAAIAAAGDWKSSCFRKYITPAPERLNEIFSALATSSL